MGGSKGARAWQFQLGAGEQRSTELWYEVAYPSDLQILGLEELIMRSADSMESLHASTESDAHKSTGEEDRPLAVATHLLSLVSPLIGPGIVWLVVSSPTVKAHAKEAVNTALTFLLIYTALTLLALFGGLLSLGGSAMGGLVIAGGVLLVLLVLPAVYLVVCILAAVMAGQGGFFRPKLIFRIL